MDKYKDESGCDIMTVGLQVVKKLANHAIKDGYEKNSRAKLLASLAAYEKEITEQVQKELNKSDSHED